MPLCWMIGEAEKKGLNFEKLIVDMYQSLASPTGRLYDSRGGVGVLWRYQPRNVQFLLDKNDDTVPLDERVTPLVHHCAVTRMARLWKVQIYAYCLMDNHYHLLLSSRREFCLGGCAISMGSIPKSLTGSIITLGCCFAAGIKRSSLMRKSIFYRWSAI